MTLIYFCAGAFAGYVYNGSLFAPDGRYLGWVDVRQQAWNADGTALGRLVDGHYILRSVAPQPSVRQTPRPLPLYVEPPLNPGTRLPYTPKPGLRDAMRPLDQIPSTDQLVGTWRLGNETSVFTEDGRYVWTAPNEEPIYGRWQLDERRLEVSYETSDPSLFFITYIDEQRMSLRHANASGALVQLLRL